MTVSLGSRKVLVLSANSPLLHASAFSNFKKSWETPEKSLLGQNS